MLLGYVVCVECGVCLLPGDVRSHVDKRHPATLPLVDARRLGHALESLDVNVRSEWVDPGRERRAAYDGVMVRLGYECQHCPVALPSLESLRQHYSRSHRRKHFDSRRPFHRVSVQRLTDAGGPARRYFTVVLQDEEMDVDSAAVIASFQDDLRSILALPTAQDPDCRKCDVWVTRFGFAEHVAGRTDFEALSKLVDLPRVDEKLHRVRVAVCDLDAHASRLLEATSVLVRRRLASDDPDRWSVSHSR